MGSEGEKWGFHGNEDVNAASGMTVQGVLIKLMENLKVANKGKPTIHLGLGDPTAFPCFRSYTSSENAIVDALRSSEFNCYPPACGVPSARRAIAEYMSRDLSCQLSPDDVFVTAGCTHAIEIVISVIARPGANILLPRPNILFLVGGLVGLLQMTPTASLKNLGSRTGLYNPQPGSRHVHPGACIYISRYIFLAIYF
ncbi:hypothetical protein I3760_03G067600 [Carya illinoinensis]|nr:hypothetical protein I3760_03G067600 [Carya illinoinensis]